MIRDEQNLTPKEMVELDRKHMWHALTQHKIFASKDPVVIVEGKGCIIKDVNGREYLDGVSGGVWCVNLGYSQSSIVEAIYRQLQQLPYQAMTNSHPIAIKLGRKLASLLPDLPRVYFSNSGSEANETAFKIVRQYYKQKYPTQSKYNIVSRYRSYHGATLGAMSATGTMERKLGYGPFAPGFLQIPPAYCYRCYFGKSYPNCDIDCARALERLIEFEGAETIAAIIVEPVVAGGGGIVPCKEYLPMIEEICRKYEVLLIADEVVTGFGRTGKMFGHQHWNVKPDMVTMAKGIASAYMPIGVTQVKEEIFAQFLGDPSEGKHLRTVNTFGGHPAACAAALENIRLIEELRICEEVAKKGAYLLNRLHELDDLGSVGEVRGLGLLAAVELVVDKKTKQPVSDQVIGQVLAGTMAEGVLLGRVNTMVRGYNNAILIAPPLIVEQAQMDQIVSALKNSLEKIK